MQSFLPGNAGNRVPGQPRVRDEYLLSPVPAVSVALALQWLDQARRWRQRRALPGAVALSAGEVFRVDSDLGPVVIKRKLEQGFKGLMVGARLREPQLQRSFRLGLKACAAGLHTPEPLLYAERSQGLQIETILVTRFDPGLQPWALLQQEALAPALLQSLGHELADWHAAGLRHRDLKGPNLLYQPATATSILLDLAGVQDMDGAPVSAAVRARDLGRLRSGAVSAGITGAQWQCLLAAYIARSALRGCVLRDDVALAGAIERFVQRKLQRYDRLNKPVH